MLDKVQLHLSLHDKAMSTLMVPILQGLYRHAQPLCGVELVLLFPGYHVLDVNLLSIAPMGIMVSVGRSSYVYHGSSIGKSRLLGEWRAEGPYGTCCSALSGPSAVGNAVVLAQSS